MKLKKPCYGQIDAPRRWWQEADRRLRTLRFRPHRLDPCLYLSHRADGVLDGLICIHVDDLLGAGDPSSSSWKKRVVDLKRTFKFREWKDNQEALEFCGGEFNLKKGIHIRHANYVAKLKPISIDRHRKSQPELAITPSELKQLRTLLCSLQWPATHGSDA